QSTDFRLNSTGCGYTPKRQNQFGFSLRQQLVVLISVDLDDLPLGNPIAAEEPNNHLFNLGGVEQSKMVRMRRSQKPTSVSLRDKRDPSGVRLRGASDTFGVRVATHPSHKEPSGLDGLLQCGILLLSKRLVVLRRWFVRHRFALETLPTAR